MATLKNQFSFIEMHNLYDNGMLKDRLDCKNYVGKYFYPLTCGTHAMIEDDEVTIIQKETMNDVYLQRFNDDIKKWYKKQTIPKKLIVDLTKPTIGDDFINVSKRLMHEHKAYNTFNKETQDKVNQMLSYIKEVYAYDDQKSFEYIIKWFSNMIKGKKNSSCLYVKSIQGVGKSTLVDFLRDFVIGRDLTTKGKSDHLKGQHNLQLLGRILVYFEELQIFSDKEWFAIDAELKDMITDTLGSYSDKYEKRFAAENTNNYIILSNYAIKGANGRRYFVCDLSPKYLDDFKYYKNLRDNCFNSNVGHAFYCYLMEIDTSDFNSLEMPDTKNKLGLIADLLSPVEKFLKFNFVVRKLGVNMKVKDLTEMFNNWTDKNTLSIHKFCEYMRELGFEFKQRTAKKTNYFTIPLESLLELAKKRKWIHELDDDMLDEDEDTKAIDVNKLYKDEIDDLRDTIECLEDSNNEMAMYIKKLEKYIEDAQNEEDDFEQKPKKKILKKEVKPVVKEEVKPIVKETKKNNKFPIMYIDDNNDDQEPKIEPINEEDMEYASSDGIVLNFDF